MANVEVPSHEDLLVSLAEVRDALECVICLEVPKNTRIFQCDNGHLLCNTCRWKVKECPICKVKLGKTRALAVEKVLSKCPKPCEFTDYGCNVKLHLPDLDEHEKVCSYKPLCCPVLHCAKMIAKMEVINHMNEKHPEGYVKRNAPSWKGFWTGVKSISTHKKVTTFRPSWLEFDDHNFFCEVMRTGNGRWCVWIYMVGTSNECNAYIYTVKLLHPDEIEELSYTGQCVSLQIEKEKISVMGTCLIFDDEVAKRFCTSDNKDSIQIGFDLKNSPKSSAN